MTTPATRSNAPRDTAWGPTARIQLAAIAELTDPDIRGDIAYDGPEPDTSGSDNDSDRAAATAENRRWRNLP